MKAPRLIGLPIDLTNGYEIALKVVRMVDVALTVAMCAQVLSTWNNDCGRPIFIACALASTLAACVRLATIVCGWDEWDE